MLATPAFSILFSFAFHLHFLKSLCDSMITQWSLCTHIGSGNCAVFTSQSMKKARYSLAFPIFDCFWCRWWDSNIPM